MTARSIVWELILFAALWAGKGSTQLSWQAKSAQMAGWQQVHVTDWVSMSAVLVTGPNVTQISPFFP